MLDFGNLIAQVNQSRNQTERRNICDSILKYGQMDARIIDEE
jgi:hypothetical protein